ncbi:SCO4225 family membrane protein [Streptomyces capitiformicae]|uniref:Uncharacterized protein n=1 Tax=Streptomyces capitiformicae TaxID=2014920 RepID=A0A918Z8K7_9ACTN|nr:hypothetical protein [Streptomyces capitiformicae]GHE40204.1 hypothetical protein GCM10017771_59270 [Streptomyces capitiformicae]
MPTRSVSLPHRLRHALAHPLALAYLALCAALLVWALITTAASDESMAGVIPVLATAPASLVLLFLPDHVTMSMAAVAFGALANATLIGLCARALRRGRD